MNAIIIDHCETSVRETDAPQVADVMIELLIGILGTAYLEEWLFG